jgi:hypothetical protein
MVQLAFVSIRYLQFDYEALRNFGAREALC